MGRIGLIIFLLLTIGLNQVMAFEHSPVEEPTTIAWNIDHPSHDSSDCNDSDLDCGEPELEEDPYLEPYFEKDHHDDLVVYEIRTSTYPDIYYSIDPFPPKRA